MKNENQDKQEDYYFLRQILSRRNIFDEKLSKKNLQNNQNALF